MQKILLATGDTDWGMQTLSMLASQGFECQLVREGKECQLTVYKEKFSTIFLDPDLTNHSGIEVLKFLKLNYPAVRVILIFPNQKRSGYYQELRSNLNRIGVVKSFIRPFPIKTLVDYLKEFTPSNSWKEVTAPDALSLEPDEKVEDKDCTRIDIESFRNGNLTIFDYYLRLKQDHFVKIFRRGETIDSARVNRYAQDGIQYLYFLTSERRNYINYMNEIISATKRKETDSKTMVSQIKNISEKFIEEIRTRGIKPNLVEESRTIAENVYNLINTSKSLRNIMSDFAQFHPKEYSKSFLVAFFSCVICKSLDWVGTTTLEAVTLGAYLHDIGVMKLPESLQNRDPATFSEEELEKYRLHPRLGADFLSTIPEIDHRVIQIVYQHRERLNGQGFPNKLDGQKIYPLAKIVALADAFSEFITQKEVPPLEGMKLFLQNREQLETFDMTMIRALSNAFIKDETNR